MPETNPYEGADTDEQRYTVYRQLLDRYDQAEYERKAQIHEGWMKLWDKNRDIQLHEDREFYKYTGMFAAGSFGVSFAFINGMIPFQTALHKPVLAAGWACLAAALIVNVAIHLISAFIHGSYCRRIAANIEREYERKPPLPVNRRESDLAIDILYVLNFVGFIGGIVCLVAFVFLNI
jgi:hypothetical protein